ncbi:MAG: hypothetical protein HYZ32_02090 [Hydrocarboniphaga effusa]|nr:hypothetical protein [Hydrocarboniphaga effusa]
MNSPNEGVIWITSWRVTPAAVRQRAMMSPHCVTSAAVCGQMMGVPVVPELMCIRTKSVRGAQAKPKG